MRPHVKGYLFDLDGVLWFGKRPIIGAKETINTLRMQGNTVLFVSNTSSRSREDNLERFRTMGIKIYDHELIVASEETAKHLAALKAKAKACVLGSRGLFNELEKANLEVQPPGSAPIDSFDFLVVGKDKTIDYTKLTFAFQVIDAGADFVAINCDTIVPGDHGLEPGAGAIVAMIAAMVERPPDIMIGKPGTFLLELALRRSGLAVEECVMVGDTLNSDIIAGNRMNMLTALVLTGNTSRTRLNGKMSCEQRPDVVLDSITDLMQEDWLERV
ncbi:MAG: HAD-IIA family hydrolase [Firmicutes bacterium]|nr:HAD-IIA family hydrolase [Bacillota bacterium]